MSDFIWVEKYRPKTIDECILPDRIKNTFKEFLVKGEIPNLLLAGPPGDYSPRVSGNLDREPSTLGDGAGSARRMAGRVDPSMPCLDRP